MNSDDEDQGDHDDFGYRAGEQGMQEYEEQEAAGLGCGRQPRRRSVREKNFTPAKKDSAHEGV
jgi:hypothetical protein